MKKAFLILFLIIASISAWADSADRQIHSLKEQYLKLRNTDIKVERVAEWQGLTDAFIKFVEKNPKHKDAPSALMNASILCEELYRKKPERDRILLSTRLLAQITSDYPASALADDALVKRAAILHSDLADSEAAREHYREVLERYPSSDMYEVAKAGLEGLKSKSKRVLVDQEPAFNSQAETGKDSPLILIDPGHGGEDFGAVGIGGLLEKDVVLSVAIELEELLKRELGAVVRLTRRKDVFVPLVERTNLANDFEADIFVSLHANASPSGKIAGIETYYLDNTGDKASLKLAERENRSIKLEGPEADLSYMLSDLIQNAKMGDSIRLGKSLQTATYSFLKTKWDVGRNLGVKRAPFYVLVGAHMPCVLMEMGFIDHKVDGANLADKNFRSDMARGIFVGLKKFIQG